MEFSYIKLNAKKRLVKNHFKCFLISSFPYVTIVLLTVLNYYLYIFLKDAELDFNGFISSYAVYVKASLFTLSVVLSFIIWKIAQLYSEKNFFSKNTKSNYRLSFRQCVNSITVSVLKFFLSIAWGGLYFSPCAVMVATLYYCINSTDYTFNVMLTLFVASAILFVLGASFLYVTLKRYSMCNYVILAKTETDALKIIEKSIELIEGNMAKYTLYGLSFVGWMLSCLLIIPVFYVLPYIKMAKYSYFKAITIPQKRENEIQKPIVFYISKKEKV